MDVRRYKLAPAIDCDNSQPWKRGAAPMSWKLRRAIKYVETHLAEPLRSYQLAKIAGLSKAHFARSFKATTGLTPNRFVMSRRLDRAVELLSASDESLADIATICGFSDQSHFCRVFRRTLGLSPGTWRRSCMRADVSGAYPDGRVLA
jgi:AraC family transcriptional regulator